MSCLTDCFSSSTSCKPKLEKVIRERQRVVILANRWRGIEDPELRKLVNMKKYQKKFRKRMRKRRMLILQKKHWTCGCSPEHAKMVQEIVRNHRRSMRLKREWDKCDEGLELPELPDPNLTCGQRIWIKLTRPFTAFACGLRSLKVSVVQKFRKYYPDPNDTVTFDSIRANVPGMIPLDQKMDHCTSRCSRYWEYQRKLNRKHEEMLELRELCLNISCPQKKQRKNWNKGVQVCLEGSMDLNGTGDADMVQGEYGRNAEFNFQVENEVEVEDNESVASWHLENLFRPDDNEDEDSIIVFSSDDDEEEDSIAVNFSSDSDEEERNVRIVFYEHEDDEDEECRILVVDEDSDNDNV